LTLGLVLGACPTPTDNNGGNAAQEAAEEFKADQAAALEKTAGTVTLGDEAAVDAALAAYNALSGEAKALLTAEKARLDSLTAKIAELKAAAFKADHAGVLAKGVEDITADDEGVVDAALAAYNGLSAGAQALLTAEKTRLDGLKARIEELKASFLAAAFKTDHAGILAKSVETVTADDEAAVDAALAAYNGLSVEAQALLGTEKEKLDGFKAKLDTLKAEAFKTDHAGVLAKSVETVTAGDEAAVDAALAAYEALNAGAQALLGTEKEKLDGLKARIDALKAAEAFKSDHAGVLSKSVETVTAGDGDAVNAALAAYNGLSGEAQALLGTEKEKLDSLKVKIDGLKAAAFKSDHAGILAKTVETVTAGDEDAVNAALAAYNGLSGEAQALVGT
jgi:hypothetical protein